MTVFSKLCVKFHASVCMMDFEKAIHRSLLKYFPNCQLVLCLFHFGQNHLSHFRNYGYKTKYQGNLEFSIYTDGSFLSNCTFYTPTNSLPAPKKCSLIKIIPQ